MMDFNALAARLLAADPPRSTPFMEGMAAVLRNRADETPVTSPYAAGTTEDDAFFAGRMRAHNEFRNLLDECGDRTAAVERLKELATARRAA